LFQSLKGYNTNCFIKFLFTLFEPSLVKELTTKKYYVGTSKSIWEGATVFWQVDKNLQCRQAKVILYNPITGNRRKWKRAIDHELLSTSKERWILERKVDAICFGKRLIKKAGIKEPSIIPCFFGEHLLSTETTKKIGIVESEKTAVLMAGFGALNLPIARNFIWLATGGSTGINWSNKDAVKVLENREVVLFPDLGKFKEWSIASLLLENCNVAVSNLLERIANNEDREKGLDISDFILREYHKGISIESIKEAPKKTIPTAIPNLISINEQVLNGFIAHNPLVDDLIKILDLDVKNGRTDVPLNKISNDPKRA